VPLSSVPRRPGGLRRPWLCALLLFASVSSAWALATPPFVAPDEFSHIIRAYTVLDGELVPQAREAPAIAVPGPGASDPQDVVQAPRSFINREFAYPSCLIAMYENTPDCMPEVTGSVEEGPSFTTAGRYPPAYYAFVGAPLKIFPGTTQGIYLARVLSAVLGSLFLASAVASAYQSRHRALLLAGIAVAATPQVFYINGVVNPSALEISAALSAWTAAAVLLSEPETTADRRLLLRLTVGLAGVASAKATGPLLVLLIAVVVLLLAPRQRLWALARQPFTLGMVGLLALAGVAAVAWTVLVSPNRLPSSPELGPEVTTNTILRHSVGLWDGWARQMVGNFGFTDLPAPQLTHYLWLLLVGALLVGAAIVCGPRTGLALSVLVTLVVVAPVVASSLLARSIGFSYQGRYTLPIAVGLPVLSALALGSRLSGHRSERRLLVVVTTLAVVGHGAAFAYALHRYTVGQPGPLDFWADPRWQPPLPPGLLLLIAVGLGAAAVGLAAASRPLTARDPSRRTPVTKPGPSPT
jgi:hypothetical protein